MRMTDREKISATIFAIFGERTDSRGVRACEKKKEEKQRFIRNGVNNERVARRFFQTFRESAMTR